MASPNDDKLRPSDLKLVLLNRQAMFEPRSRDESEFLWEALIELHKLNQAASLPCEDDDCPRCEEAAHQENNMIRRSLYGAA